jgi:hypothetical protein
MEAQTTIEALKMAIKNRCYPNEDLVHHSDMRMHLQKE